MHASITEFDPYYAGRGKKSTTFRLEESDEWTDKTAGILFGDVQKIKAIWSGTLPIPVSLHLQFLDGDVYGISPPQLSLNLKKALRALPGALEFKSDPAASYGTVSLSSKKVTVSLAGLKTCTLHLGTSYDSNSARVGLHYDILVACAITLSSAGYCDLAARLFRVFAASSSLVINRDVGVLMAQCMIKAQRISDALNLAEVLLAKPESRYAAQGLFISMLRSSAAMSEGERQILQTFLERRTRIEEGTKDPLSAATANYNLGNYLRSAKSHRAAFRRYRRAAEFDPKYLDRGYFCRELAGVLFLLARYKLSARLYEWAVKLGEVRLTKALFADALMFSGDYASALRELTDYAAAEQNPKSEYLLKLCALESLQQLEPTKQRRQTAEAIKLATSDSRLSDKAFEERLGEALKLDTLCGMAWFNLARLLIQQGKHDEACIAFVWATIADRCQAGAWINAFTLALSSKKHFVLAPHIIVAARFATGDAVTEELLKMVDLQSDDFPKREFIEAVDKMLALVPDEQRPFEVRLLGEPSEVKVVHSSGAPW
jgi:tetratricopeptide (TPR) repeat protein